MMSLDDFSYFALVVEHGGFSAAERATGIAKSKLSRRIHDLEQQLNIRLIQRNSRQFAVTDIGLKIYEQAKIMRNAAQSAQDLVHQLSEQPRGIVRISVPTSIAQNELAQILPEFLQLYPEVKIDLHISNRRFDVINENIDIALRVRSHLDNDAGLIVRRFARIEQHLCASPDFIQRYGRPTAPQQLSDYRLLSLPEPNLQYQLELHHATHATTQIKFEPHLTAFDFVLLRHLAVQSAGIVLLPDSISRDAIKTGELDYILPDWHSAHGIFHMIYPSRQGILPAVKVMIEFLAERLTEH